MKIGGNGNTPILSGTSSPDGVVTAGKGTLYVDQSAGVQWVNQDGTTRWEPSDMLDGAGVVFWDDLLMFVGYNNIGGGSSANQAGDAASPGVRRFTVTAAGTDGVVVTPNSNSSGVLIGGGKIWSKWSFRVPMISDGTNNIVIRLGLGDQGSFGDNVDGVYLEYDFATYSDHRWRLCTSSNSTQTKTDTGIALTASSTTMTQALIAINADGTSVTVRIGGVAAASAVTTNIPTGAGRVLGAFWGLVLKQLGSSARTFDLDGVGFKQVFTAPRTF